MARSSKKKRSRSRGRRNPRSKPRVRSRSRSRSKALRVGTDCSGIEAPIQALKQLRIPFKHVWSRIPFKHVWSSEIDKHCIESIKANYKPGRLYGDKDGPYPDGDMRNRNHNELPDVDLYVCGFPCQSFSQAGVRGSSRRGLSDPRGNIIYSCLDTIKAKRPREGYIVDRQKRQKRKIWRSVENNLE
jgi:site-specific DNA-cytosine methylase